MKGVFTETRVPGYLTLEHGYFDQEKTIGIENWITSIKKITLNYASKNKLDTKPIQNILDKVIYTGETPENKHSLQSNWLKWLLLT